MGTKTQSVALFSQTYDRVNVLTLSLQRTGVKGTHVPRINIHVSPQQVGLLTNASGHSTELILETFPKSGPEPETKSEVRFTSTQWDRLPPCLAGCVCPDKRRPRLVPTGVT